MSVKKISLCDENFSGHCGDLLFHTHIPSPDFSPNGVKNLSRWSRHRSQSSGEAPSPLSLSNPGSTESASVILRRPPPTVSISEVGPATSQPQLPLSTACNAGLTATASPPLCHLKPVSHITCYQNLMAIVYLDCVGLFHLKEAIGWHLVWMSPCLASPVDRVDLTCKATNPFIQFPSASSGSPMTVYSTPSSPNTGSSYNYNQNNILSTGATNSRSYGGGAPTSGLAPASPGPPSARLSGGTSATSNNNNSSGGGGIAPTAGAVPPTVCLLAIATRSSITLWCIYPPTGNSTSFAMATTSGPISPVLGSASVTPILPVFCSAQSGDAATPLPMARESWASDLVGRYGLNGRAVDHLLFIGAHLVALSQRGLVGVRHAMTNTWQVWSTAPILSHSVANSELLLLGSANGRICSINIQKFPLRIVDNDLLMTEMYRDPLLDPITALSAHLTSHITSLPSRGSMEIAYGTLSGRVCLIVQYPENFGYSPHLLQTFTVHRSMVTRVALSEKHLISVCNEFNHVRTWSINRFRGVISTQPGPIPFASFHVTALETGSPQRLVDSVVDAVRCCLSQRPPTNTERPLLVVDPRLASRSLSVTSAVVGHGWAAAALSRSRSGQVTATNSGADVSADTPGINRCSIPPGAGQYNDIVVLPRTSWLHEAPGNASGRTSLVTSPNGVAPRELGSQPHPTIGIESTPVVELQRFANDPGPYGDRDDVLVFLQKLTPHANQLFLRLASNGRRIGVVKAIGGSPISSFTVHELDGFIRPSAYPRRYVFTGHPDGSIQVWDLTTALSMIKPTHSIFVNSGYFEDSQGAGGNGGSSAGGATGYGGSGTGGWTTASLGLNGASALLWHPGLFPPASTVCCGGDGWGSMASASTVGGPTSKELLHLLESCQLGAASSCYSLAAAPQFAGEDVGSLSNKSSRPTTPEPMV